MQRYLCIHGHFYQPPRENPWLESIETQDSAAPFHDWNERINAECYAVNAASRILDGQERILAIVNNYSRMSFNFGPTLLSWMEKQDPNTYRAILDSDRQSRKRFSGHGNALAQVYHHMILPLANLADKRTQVRWGIRDFECRFGRRPEGMWLAETAVDVETLEVLAEEGILFTILAPHQAGRVRPRKGKEWHDVRNGSIDSSRAYRQVLPSGKSVALFFYHGAVARAVAFEGLLRRAEFLVDRLLSTFHAESREIQLSHIATDGESYGHHHRFGDMALAYAFSLLEKRTDVSLTNYGEFLEKHPPTWEVEIVEGSSWSCSHGVERWRNDCGCNATATRGWNQAWRGPLRDALDWLRDSLIPRFEAKGKQYFKDPWVARNEYLSIFPERSAQSVNRFLQEQALPEIQEKAEKRTIALKLMELQRNAMLMYTSCGWFFDELSGIETVQILRYAGRAIQLAEDIFDCRIEKRFLDKLKEARSNLPELGTGADIYRREVSASKIQLEDVVAHYAICSIFQPEVPTAEVHCYRVENLDRQEYHLGVPRLVVGRLHIMARVTRESATVSWGVLHFGDHNLLCGVRRQTTESDYEQIRQTWQIPAEQADLTQIIRLLEKNFPGTIYSLRSLFHDERRRLIHMILQSRLEENANVYRRLYRDNLPLMRLLSELTIPQPIGFRASAEFALHASLEECFQERENSPDCLTVILQEAERVGIHPDLTLITRQMEKKLEQLILPLESDSDNMETLVKLRKWVETAYQLRIRINPSGAQIVCHRLMQESWPRYCRQAAAGDQASLKWKREFQHMAEQLGFSSVLFQ